MTIEQRFIACDGKEFNTEEECVKYEKTINELTDIIISLIKVKQICNKYNHCHECVFCNEDTDNCILREDIPEYWHLERIGG